MPNEKDIKGYNESFLANNAEEYVYVRMKDGTPVTETPNFQELDFVRTNNTYGEFDLDLTLMCGNTELYGIPSFEHMKYFIPKGFIEIKLGNIDFTR